MARKNYTHIHLLIDRSGSMSSIRTSTIDGINEFVNAQKSIPGEVKITLVQFDHEYNVLVKNQDIHNFEPITEASYIPRGSTALLDALGTSIDAQGIELSNLPEHERPELVMLVVMTDGMENSSSKYTLKEVSDRIEHQQSFYNWKFEFLSSDLSSIQMAKSLKFEDSRICYFEKNDSGVDSMFLNLSTKITEERREVSHKNV